MLVELITGTFEFRDISIDSEQEKTYKLWFPLLFWNKKGIFKKYIYEMWKIPASLKRKNAFSFLLASLECLHCSAIAQQFSKVS